jgi:hypothetical protein
MGTPEQLWSPFSKMMELRREPCAMEVEAEQANATASDKIFMIREGGSEFKRKSE